MITPGRSWFKSSYSSGSSGDCVEIAVAWDKSSCSSGDSGDCVEVAAQPEVVRVRDSKEADGPHLSFSPDAWASFLAFATRRG